MSNSLIPIPRLYIIQIQKKNQTKKQMIQSQQQLSRVLNRYFKQPTVDQKDISRLLVFLGEYSQRNQHMGLVQKIFKVAETVMRKQNLKVIIKRYLHILNQILQKDEKLENQCNSKYQNLLAAEIVAQCISLLRNVINYGPLELLAEIKFYRKRWAKRINDFAYSLLQVEAQRQLKVDLDRGFSEELVKKLTKIYQKRQFSRTDLEKYLPSSNWQSGSEARKTSAAVSSSSSQEEGPRKRVKKQSQQRVSQRRNDYNSDMDMSRVSYITSNSNTFGNGYASDPRRPNQIMYQASQPSIYPAYQQPPRVINSAVGQRNYYGVQPPNYYPQPPPTTTSYNPYFYGQPNHSQYGYQPQQAQQYPPPYQNYGTVNMGHGYMGPQKHSKLLLNTQLLKRSFSNQCKFCGILISIQQKYNEHILAHFQQSQQKYEQKHSRTDHNKKPNKQLLPNSQQWIQEKYIKLTDKKFQVRVANIGTIATGIANQCSDLCEICKGELKVSWCDVDDAWVYEDSIKVVLANQQCICHSQCYHTLEEFEKSSDDNLSKSDSRL